MQWNELPQSCTKLSIYAISFFITDERPKPWFDETDRLVIAEEQTQLACYFIYFWDVNPTFKWFFAHQQFTEQATTRLKYANGTAIFRSVLLYNFTHMEDKENLTCSVSVAEKNGSYHGESSVILNIHCM